MVKRNRFTINETDIYIEGQKVRTYGITASGPEGTETVEDISPDAAAVARLCARLEKAALSPLHLRDAVHDFLHATAESAIADD